MAFKLPESPESRAYRAVVQVLRTDPTLRGYGLKIRAWEGGQNDAKEIESLGELPMLLVEPGRSTSGWLSPRQHESTMPLELRIAVPSEKACDLFDLWHAVRTALFPSDPARLLAVRTIVGETSAAATLTGQGTGVLTLPDGLRAVHASGVLALTIHVNT